MKMWQNVYLLWMSKNRSFCIKLGHGTENESEQQIEYFARNHWLCHSGNYYTALKHQLQKE